MIYLEWVYSLLALPSPWIVMRALKHSQGDSLSILRFHPVDDISNIGSFGRNQNSSHLVWRLAAFAWFLLIVAAARPVWQGEPIEQGVSGRDLMMAVDLSGSMEVADFMLKGHKVDRLTATKAVAGEFIERRMGDRVGLILFGEKAYLQAPLTFDRKTVRTLLDESVIGLAGDKTAIGDAIGLAVKRLKDNPKDQRVLILLSDGANTAGSIAPLQAAELAAKAGLRIYTIGIGAEEMTIRDLLGSRTVNPSQDLDEPTMRGIAEKTGGRYFRARDVRELEGIYRLLDELEPIERDKRYYRPRTELYPWPLGAALLLSGLIYLARRHQASA